jgi:hypothetical protein
MKSPVGRFRDSIARDGWPATLRMVRHRIAETYHERRLGIRTVGHFEARDLGYPCDDFKGYAPAPYRDFHEAMKHVSVRTDRDVFIDYGSGMGRIVVAAATYAFRRVIGVEMAANLACVAQDNVERARGHLRCRDVRIIRADAAALALDDDVTIIHFFNPFGGPILARVVANIRESLERAPREITILFFNPLHFDPILPGLGWIRFQEKFVRPSLVCRKNAPSDTYAIYRAVP